MGDDPKSPSDGSEDSKAGVMSLIPEVYYDLIARVPAGVVLAIAAAQSILSSLGRSLDASAWLTANGILFLTTAAAFLGLAGIIGILISPIGDRMRSLYWRRSWTAVVVRGPFKAAGSTLRAAGCRLLPRNADWSKLTDSDLHGLDRWVGDYLRIRTSYARGLLGKMRAEADMCCYLAASFFLLPLVQLSLNFLFYLSGLAHGFPAHLRDPSVWLWYAASWGATALLCASGAYRTKRLVLRMLSMLSVTIDCPDSMEEA
jgi:hypothetical protein